MFSNESETRETRISNYFLDQLPQMKSRFFLHQMDGPQRAICDKGTALWIDNGFHKPNEAIEYELSEY